RRVARAPASRSRETPPRRSRAFGPATPGRDDGQRDRWRAQQERRRRQHAPRAGTRPAPQAVGILRKRQPVMTTRQHSTAAVSAFGRLVESITQQLQRGERVDWPALARDHPEFAAKLDAVRPALEALGQLSRAGESAVSGMASLPEFEHALTEPLG